jgi:predicted nucleic acid-binding protein
VCNVLRRLERAGIVTRDDANNAAATLENIPTARVPHRPLSRRVWAMRHSVSTYDATYLALAEELNLPLVTCDAKLSRSNGHDAKIELYELS